MLWLRSSRKIVSAKIIKICSRNESIFTKNSRPEFLEVVSLTRSELHLPVFVGSGVIIGLIEATSKQVGHGRPWLTSRSQHVQVWMTQKVIASFEFILADSRANKLLYVCNSPGFIEQM